MCGFQNHHRDDRHTHRTAAPDQRESVATADQWESVATVADDDVRVSAAERDAVIDELRRHTADGRLTLDEFGDRTNQALDARTAGELRRSLRELPGLGRIEHRSAGRSAGRVAWPVPTPLLLVAVAAVVAVATGAWWLVFPLLWFGCAGLRSGHRRHRRPGRPEAI